MATYRQLYDNVTNRLTAMTKITLSPNVTLTLCKYNIHGGALQQF